MMETKILWYDGTVTKPAKNGRYLAVNSTGCQFILFFAEGYWNSTVDADGVLQKEYAMDDIVWWAVFPELPIGKE